MSADNWAICPRCTEVRRKAALDLSAKVDKSYGSVPIEEFDRLRSECDALESAQPRSTLREDWEIGIYEGELFISYKGRCSECGFHKYFEHTEAVS